MKPAKGLKIADLRVGKGREVAVLDIVHFHCTCRLSKGDVVFTTRDTAPYQLRAGSRDAYVALDQGLVGMRVGGLRQIKTPPHLTYYERQGFPNIPESAVLIYEIELIRICERWDNTLHIRESPIYSENTKALERRFRELQPSTDPGSEYQQVQAALFSHAEKDYHRHTKTEPGAPPNGGHAAPLGGSESAEGPLPVSYRVTPEHDMTTTAKKVHKAILGCILVLFLLVDFIPRFGPPNFRYTGSDPSRIVQNLGYPLALFIYDRAVNPPLVFGPLAQLFVPLQFLILGLAAIAPSFAGWCNHALHRMAPRR